MSSDLEAQRPDVAATLRQLAGFQRAAAENAHRRLFEDGASGRFLIADEVGLGKTLIARGITALAIDSLWESVERIDVVYVCSNAAIARQNVRRLGFGAMKPVDRLTLLPITVHELEGAKLNFVALTPGTSFDKGRRLGTMRERALIYHLLDELWPVSGTGPLNLLQGNAGKKWWRELVREFFDRFELSEELAARARETYEAEDERERAEGGLGLRARWEETCGRFGYARKTWPREDRILRNELVAELRTLLARACIDALEPDLVILDEFQRFKHLLDPDEETEQAELAQRLFEWSDGHERARVLLLSATPYKMYTLTHESDEDDHFEDFLRTVAFLQGDEARTNGFRALLEEYRRAIYRVVEDEGAAACAAARAVEQELRRVMSRTERTAASDRGDGMVRTVEGAPLELRAREVADWVALDALPRRLEVSGALEYWKSAPYLLSFLRGYVFDERLEEAVDLREEGVGDEVEAASGMLLDPRDLERYAEVDPANGRMRALFDDMVESGLWQCLWLPPSAPSYALSGSYADAFERNATKRLVFSAWQVVPRTIAGVVSYEVERRALLAEDPESVNTAEARDRRAVLLQFSRSDGRLTGMPVLGWLYPSSALAGLGDSRRHAVEAGARLDRDALLARVEALVDAQLEPLIAGAPTEGPEDEAWYWAGPILLDLLQDRARAAAFWEAPDLAASWVELPDANGWLPQPDEGWAAHVAEAAELIAPGIDSSSALDARSFDLGRPPADLVSVLACIAVGGPAVCALRSLSRVLPDADANPLELRFSAGRIAWGFRTLFNRPESTAIVRRRERRIPFWRLVLDHAIDGGLSDLLDEHIHLLRDFEGLFDRPSLEALPVLVDSLRSALTLRTTRGAYRSLTPDQQFADQNLRSHFALRFGDAESDDDAGGQRGDVARAAFNSPFWPFVLASTSVGQEGLDFHPWCHAVVHWNLPSNPVDLEQREGRVHRYKGHAVRKNVALDFAQRELADPTHRDPWSALFARAREATTDHRGGLVPHWVYEATDGAHVERHVPAHPHSRDALRHEALRRSLALYRMVFGQPRQDDLLAFLAERLSGSTRDRLVAELRVNLAPGVASSS